MKSSFAKTKYTKSSNRTYYGTNSFRNWNNKFKSTTSYNNKDISMLIENAPTRTQK